MKKRIQKKDIDGINDIYEKPMGLPNPQLDSDDIFINPNDPNAPLEDALDILDGDFNTFAVSTNPDLVADEDATALDGEYNVFELSGNNDTDAEENAVDIMSFQRGEERFPLSSSTEQDNNQKHGEIGAGIRDKAPEKTKKKLPAGVVASIITCSALVLFLLWTIFGIIYSTKYNKHIYEQSHQGVDVKFINPDFMYFLIIDDLALPVVQSATPKYYTTLNGNFFAPGTLTTSNGFCITGSPKLLPVIDPTLIGKKITIETRGYLAEYEIHSIGDYDPHQDYDTPTIFIEDKSSQSGYTAIFTKALS